MSPKVGAVVMTPQGRGVVTESNILTGKVKVRLDNAPDSAPVEMHRDDLNAVVRDSRPHAAEPHPAPAEAAPVENAPAAEAPKAEKPAQKQEKPQQKPQHHHKPQGDKNGTPNGHTDHRRRGNPPRNKRQG